MYKKFLPVLILLLPLIIGIEECAPPLTPPAFNQDIITLQGVEIIFSFKADQLISIQAIDRNDNVAAVVKIGEAGLQNQWGRMLFNKTLKMSTLLPNKEKIEDGPLIGEKLFVEITFKKLRFSAKKPANISAAYILGSGSYQIL